MDCGHSHTTVTAVCDDTARDFMSQLSCRGGRSVNRLLRDGCNELTLYSDAQLHQWKENNFVWGLNASVSANVEVSRNIDEFYFSRCATQPDERIVG